MKWIYCIQNSVDGKRYIGQTSDVNRRFRDHKKDLRRNSHKNRHLQFAWNKYGESRFEFSIMCRCDDFNPDNLEKEYIREYNTTSDKHGYNLTSGGNLLTKMAEESKRKIAKWNLGRHHTEETKAKLSRAHKGRKPPPKSKEALAAMSERMTGNKYALGKTWKLSEETKAKMSLAHTGKKYNITKERIEQLREGFQNIRLLRTITNKGKKYKHSEEFLRKRAAKKYND